MTVGDETREVTSGMSIFISSNQPHGLINKTDGVLRYLSAGSPTFGKEEEIALWLLGNLKNAAMNVFITTPSRQRANC